MYSFFIQLSCHKVDSYYLLVRAVQLGIVVTVIRRQPRLCDADYISLQIFNRRECRHAALCL
jgi:hypothetical protein